MSICVNCNYSLEGLNSVVCPECGFSNDHASIEMFDAQRRRRRAMWSATVLFILFTGCCVFSPINLVSNIGLPFGCYGELNRTTHHVRSIEGVTIVGTRVNYDTRVEEFTIDVLVDAKTTSSIYIPDVPYSKRLQYVDEWREKDSRDGMMPPARTP